MTRGDHELNTECIPPRDVAFPTVGQIDVEYFVFAGGGAKGLAFLGSMIVIEEYMRSKLIIQKHIKGSIGTSIGCIFALACVTEMKCKDMFKLVFEEHILDNLQPDLDLNRLCVEYGLDNGEKLKKVIILLLETCFPEQCQMHAGFAKSITLQDLHRHTGKTLICTCTDVSTCSVVYLSHDTVPHMPVWMALLASMSIPLLFKPVCFDGHMYVDGGVLENLAVNAFPIEKSLVFRFASKASVQTDTQLLEVGVHEYIYRIFACAMDHRESDSLRNEPRISMQEFRIITVDCGNLRTIEFVPSISQQMNAVMRGMLSTHHGMWRTRLGIMFQKSMPRVTHKQLNQICNSNAAI